MSSLPYLIGQEYARLKLGADDSDISAPFLSAGMGLGTAAAIPAGLAYAGTRHLQKQLPNYALVNPDLEGVAQKFKSLGANTKLTAPQFLEQYIQHGGQLTRAPAVKLPSGEILTGEQFVRKVRGSGLTGQLSEALTGRKFTPRSMGHYKAFSKGPLAAFAQMAQEVYENPVETMRSTGKGGRRGTEVQHSFKGSRGLTEDFTTTLAGSRYEAAKALRDSGVPLTPTTFNKQLTETLHQRMPGASPGDVARLVESTEGHLIRHNPGAYKQFFDIMQQGGDPTHVQNDLLKSFVGDAGSRTQSNIMMRRARQIAKDMMGYEGKISKLPLAQQEKILKRMLESGDPLTHFLSMRIRHGWAKAPQQYGSLIDPLMSYRKAYQQAGKSLESMRGLTRKGLMIGGGVAGGALLLDLLRRTYNKAQESKAGNRTIQIRY